MSEVEVPVNNIRSTSRADECNRKVPLQILDIVTLIRHVKSEQAI